MSEERRHRIFLRLRRFFDLLSKSDTVFLQEGATKIAIGIVFTGKYRDDGIAVKQILERWRDNARELNRLEYEDNEE